MTTYEWKRAARLQGNPQVVGECLQGIRQRQGSLTAALVVQEAALPTSPLHNYFQWDDTAAAHAWREQQAYYLLRSVAVRVESGEETRQVRAFVVVRVDEQAQSYEPLVDVMEDSEMRAEVLARAWKELEEWQARYQEFEELAAVFIAMEQRAAARVPALV